MIHGRSLSRPAPPFNALVVVALTFITTALAFLSLPTPRSASGLLISPQIMRLKEAISPTGAEHIINDRALIHQSDSWFANTANPQEWKRIIHLNPQVYDPTDHPASANLLVCNGIWTISGPTKTQRVEQEQCVWVYVYGGAICGCGLDVC
jgi:hypothetical protein